MDVVETPVDAITPELMERCLTPLSDDHDDKFGVPSLEELGECGNECVSVCVCVCVYAGVFESVLGPHYHCPIDEMRYVCLGLLVVQTCMQVCVLWSPIVCVCACACHTDSQFALWICRF